MAMGESKGLLMEAGTSLSSSAELRLLLVEDNPGDADLVARMLKENGIVPAQIQRATLLSEAIEQLKKQPVDAIILDLGLPDSAGLDTLRAVRMESLEVAVLVLTGLDDEQMGLAAVAEGAEDYLVKGLIDGRVLVRELRYAVERQRNKQQLRESMQFLHASMDALSANIAILDESGAIVFVNRAWRAFAAENGIKPGLVGEGANYLAVCDGATGEDAEMAKLFAERIREVLSGKRFLFEMEYPCHSPFEQRWFIARVTSFQGDGPRRAAIAHENITTRKRAEAEKAALEAQLQQAQKMESVGRLAGGVAHDFNNMLAVILGYTEVALGQLNPGLPLHADLEEVHKAGKRAADLTRQLLAFARKQVVMPKVLDLNECADGMLKMLQRLLGENISLSWNPGTGLWQVNMDPSQIDQILANLCVNARDAIVDVGRITIETANRSVDGHFCAGRAGFAPGEYVTLAVSDTGCGMDRETQKLIFEPFFTTKEMGKGTGLGLATVFGIVKQNGGHISVYSEMGRGTTFTIYLPRHAGETEEAGTQNAVEAIQRGSETILLTEDEPSMLKLVKTLLEGRGYTVLAALTPDEAIRLARDHDGKVHLLMTDVVMPEMNGRDLAQNVSSLVPQIKCLFMSGYTADVIAHQGVLDKGTHFIQKPFSESDLASKVREVLDSE